MLTQNEFRLKVLKNLELKEDLGILTDAEELRMIQLIHEIYFL